MSKVLISDTISPLCMDVLEKAHGIDADIKTGLSPEQLVATIGEYNALIVRSSTKVTGKIIEAADSLRVIGRAGIGIDNIDLAAATRRGIIVMNTPGGNTITTAEHSIAMMMSLARKIPQATASMRLGKWEKKKFQGTELFGKTLGIIGVGNIGSIVANRALGLKMRVIAYDPFLTEETADRLGVDTVTLEELYKQSDFISIHVPLTEDTRGMIDRKALSEMKNSVRIICCARGGIIDEGDLASAIEHGDVAGAALDVFVEEPPAPDNPLLGMDNVILTPHLGASTSEAQEKVAVAIAEQIADYLQKGSIRNALNVPSIPSEAVKTLRPFLILCEKLGIFHGQIASRAIEEITVIYCGEVVKFDLTPLTVAVLKGLLQHVMDQPINYVNAPVIARERGMKVVEIKSSSTSDFTSSITVTIRTRAGSKIIEGTLFGKDRPRIVRIDEFLLDAIPSGNLLILNNEDKAGVIGKVGTLLAEAGINIAGMHLGRSTIGGKALSIWNIDTSISNSIVDQLLSLPNIISAKRVSFE